MKLVKLLAGCCMAAAFFFTAAAHAEIKTVTLAVSGMT